MRALTRAAAALLLVTMVAPVCGQAPAPRALAGWVAELTWSPEYCDDDLASKAPQCTGEHYFEISGLQPVLPGEQPEACPDGDSPDREAMEKLLWIVPNKRTLQKMWSDQGLCSGLAHDEYFRQVERARRRILVPAQYRGVVETQDTKAETVRKAFTEANAGLPESGLYLRCSGSHWLREVRVCLAPDFSFRSCGSQALSNCKQDIRIREIRASRVGRP